MLDPVYAEHCAAAARSAISRAKSNLRAAEETLDGCVIAASALGVTQQEIARLTGWSRTRVKRVSETERTRDDISCDDSSAES